MAFLVFIKVWLSPESHLPIFSLSVIFLPPLKDFSVDGNIDKSFDYTTSAGLPLKQRQLNSVEADNKIFEWKSISEWMGPGSALSSFGFDDHLYDLNWNGMTDDVDRLLRYNLLKAFKVTASKKRLMYRESTLSKVTSIDWTSDFQQEYLKYW